MNKIFQATVNKNKSLLSEPSIYHELQRRMVPDPSLAFMKIRSYIHNLLIWQKELTIVELMDINGNQLELSKHILNDFRTWAKNHNELYELNWLDANLDGFIEELERGEK